MTNCPFWHPLIRTVFYVMNGRQCNLLSRISVWGLLLEGSVNQLSFSSLHQGNWKPCWSHGRHTSTQARFVSDSSWTHIQPSQASDMRKVLLTRLQTLFAAHGSWILKHVYVIKNFFKSVQTENAHKARTTKLWNYSNNYLHYWYTFLWIAVCEILITTLIKLYLLVI